MLAGASSMACRSDCRYKVQKNAQQEIGAPARRLFCSGACTGSRFEA
jgi:hypothetical protein